MMMEELKANENKLAIVRYYAKQFTSQTLFLLRQPALVSPEIDRKLYLDDEKIESRKQVVLQNVDQALHDALLGKSKLSKRVLKLSGMTGAGFRHFLNNLVDAQENAYLEVGVWKASSAISAGYRNQKKIVAIDDWSEFTGPRKIARRRLKKYLMVNFELIEGNFLDEVIKVQERIGVYFYDGGHDFDSHVNAVNVIQNLNFDVLVFIVDDYNALNVVSGTEVGLEKLLRMNTVEMIAEWMIKPNKSDKKFQFGSWHNGYRIMLFNKI